MREPSPTSPPQEPADSAEHAPVVEVVRHEAGPPEPPLPPPLPPPPLRAVAAWWIMGLSLTAVVSALLQIALDVTDRGLFLLCLTFGVATVAAWMDAATRRIPNVVTYPAIVIGLALHLAIPSLAAADLHSAVLWIGADVTVSGMSARELLMDGVFGFALCAAIGILSFMTAGLGGGDVKLLGAMGALLGFDAVIPVLFNTLIVAAIVGLINLALNGGLVARLQAVALHVLVAAVTRKDFGKVYPFKKTESPFGISVLGGLIIAQFLPLYSFIM